MWHVGSIYYLLFSIWFINASWVVLSECLIMETANNYLHFVHVPPRHVGKKKFKLWGEVRCTSSASKNVVSSQLPVYS